jgi:hypothetical protein
MGLKNLGCVILNSTTQAWVCFCMNNIVVLNQYELFIYLIYHVSWFIPQFEHFTQGKIVQKLALVFIGMGILSTYWGTHVIWARRCLLYNTLRGMNLPLGMT